MSYLFKQKIDLTDLVEINCPSRVILVAEPEEYLLEIYSSHLESHNFNVVRCKTVDALTQAVRQRSPHLLLLSVRLLPDFYRLFYLLGNLRKNFPDLRILTIGDGVDAEIIKRLMSVGVSSHIERKLTRPQDIILIAKSILEY